MGLYLRVGRQLTSPRYFHDWVLHYRQLYKEWAESVLPTTNIPSSSKGLYRSRDLWERLKDCQDRQLREEFAFAKATFFENGASMRLNIHHSLRDSVLLFQMAHRHRGFTKVRCPQYIASLPNPHFTFQISQTNSPRFQTSLNRASLTPFSTMSTAPSKPHLLAFCVLPFATRVCGTRASATLLGSASSLLV